MERTLESQRHASEVARIIWSAAKHSPQRAARIARRLPKLLGAKVNGTWPWVIDQFSISTDLDSFSIPKPRLQNFGFDIPICLLLRCAQKQRFKLLIA